MWSSSIIISCNRLQHGGIYTKINKYNKLNNYRPKKVSHLSYMSETLILCLLYKATMLLTLFYSFKKIQYLREIFWNYSNQSVNSPTRFNNSSVSVFRVYVRILCCRVMFLFFIVLPRKGISMIWYIVSPFSSKHSQPHRWTFVYPCPERRFLFQRSCSLILVFYSFSFYICVLRRKCKHFHEFFESFSQVLHSYMTNCTF